MNLKVKIRYFALYRDLSGKSDEILDVNEGSTLATLLDSVKKVHPIFEKQPGEFLLALNEEYAERDAVLSEGDEVAIFPNVSGG